MCLSLLPSHMLSKKKKRFLIWWPSLSNANFKWCRQSPELTSLNHVFLNGFTSDKRLRRYTILLTDGFLSQKVKTNCIMNVHEIWWASTPFPKVFTSSLKHLKYSRALCGTHFLFKIWYAEYVNFEIWRYYLWFLRHSPLFKTNFATSDMLLSSGECRRHTTNILPKV